MDRYIVETASGQALCILAEDEVAARIKAIVRLKAMFGFIPSHTVRRCG